jgi:hypothetical protein
MCNSESTVNSLASPSSPIGGFHIDDLEAPFAPLEGMSPLESIMQTHVNQQHNEALPHLSLGPHEQFLGMHPISLPFTIPSNAPPRQQIQQLDPTIPSLTPCNTQEVPDLVIMDIVPTFEGGGHSKLGIRQGRQGKDGIRLRSI